MAVPIAPVLPSKQSRETVWAITRAPDDPNSQEPDGRTNCTVFSGAYQPYSYQAATDEVSFGTPIRRTTLDGGQYDSSPTVHRRNGLPWGTYFFGYHLGLVAYESNWDNANVDPAGAMVGFFRFPSAANNVELTSLPPPWVEDDVVEYVNRADFPAQPDGQFFYTALAGDKAILDAVPVWQRTGRARRA